MSSAVTGGGKTPGARHVDPGEGVALPCPSAFVAGFVVCACREWRRRVVFRLLMSVSSVLPQVTSQSREACGAHSTDGHWSSAFLITRNGVGTGQWEGDLFRWDAICFRPGAERENSDNSFRVGHFCGVAPDRRASVPTPNFCQDMATEGRGLGLTVSAVATNLSLHACLCDRMAFTLQAKVS